MLSVEQSACGWISRILQELGANSSTYNIVYEFVDECQKSYINIKLKKYKTIFSNYQNTIFQINFVFGFFFRSFKHNDIFIPRVQKNLFSVMNPRQNLFTCHFNIHRIESCSNINAMRGSLELFPILSCNTLDPMLGVKNRKFYLSNRPFPPPPPPKSRLQMKTSRGQYQIESNNGQRLDGITMSILCGNSIFR